MRRTLVTTTILAGAASLTALPAHAQSVEPEGGYTDEIVVTAQRREANLQDVPASVTALSTQGIEEQQIREVGDLQYQVPNISIAAGTGTANSARIFLRGVGEDESRGAVDPAVGIYVDGIYIGRQVGALFDIVDLERIEVLRGPQGTLYGRNSNGGAIKLVSKKPGGENAFRVGATLGNEGRQELRGMANLALSEAAGLRVTGLLRQRDGFWDVNPISDTIEGREVGELDVAAIRGVFSADLAEGWNVQVIADHTQDDSDPVPDSAAPPNDRDGNVFTIEPLPSDESCDDAPTAIGCFTDYRSSVTTQGVSVNVTGTLGAFDVMSLTGYREMEDDLSTRIGLPYLQATEQDQFSQEVTLTSNGEGPFGYVLGAYYFDEDVRLDTTFVFPSTVVVGTSSVALFGHGTYELSPQTTLTAGLRWTDETREFAGRNIGLSVIAGPGLPPGLDFAREEKVEDDNVTYEIGVDHRFNDAVMAYAKYGTGFKSAGFSPDCFAPAVPGVDDACYRFVEREDLDSFEVGLRTNPLGGQARLNVTYFYNVYDNLQIGATVPDLGFTRFNVPETEIQGVEVEGNWNLTDAFSVFGNLGLLDAEYTEVDAAAAGGLTNSGASCGLAEPTDAELIDCAFGLDLKNAPEWKGQIGARYAAEVAGGELLLIGDVSFEDDSWSLVANDPPHALTDPGAILNARAAWTSPDDRYTVAVWGRNLTDEAFWRAASAQSFTVYASPPITYGIDLDVRF